MQEHKQTTCPLNATHYQLYCCLVEQHIKNDTLHMCEYQFECKQIKVSIESIIKSNIFSVLNKNSSANSRLTPEYQIDA